MKHSQAQNKLLNQYHFEANRDGFRLYIREQCVDQVHLIQVFYHHGEFVDEHQASQGIPQHGEVPQAHGCSYTSIAAIAAFYE